MKLAKYPLLVLLATLSSIVLALPALTPVPLPAPLVPITAEAPARTYPRALSFAPSPLACGGSGTNLTAPTWNDVAACHTAAPNAATITVSSGSYTVTTTTTITKFVKIVCAGTCTLTDNVADVADLINITESTAGSIRLEGFTFVSGTGQHSNPNGIVKMVMQTNGKPILITGNTFTMGTTGDAIIAGVNRGVIWNNTASATWIDVPGVRCSNNVAFVRHKNTALTAVWTEAPYYGTDDTDGQHNLYIETNTLDNVFEGIDVDANGRNVTRYNMIINSGVLNHGADTGTIAGRYIDLYNNTFVWSTTPHCDGGTAPASVDSFIALRGAPALIHSNVIPHISSMAWGSKSEVKFYNEQLRRNAGPYACWNSGYPSPYQVGWGYVPPLVQAGSSGVFQGLEGVYLWSNTGAGNYNSPSLQDYAPNECGGAAPLVSTYIQSGRDYFTALAKPAYTAYPYPHPLTFTDTFYVNKAGNNGNSCTTAQSSVDTDAKLTIAAGIACLSASDTLLIGDGTYAENALNPTDGVVGANTIVQAETRNAVIVKPPYPNGDGYAVPFGFTHTYVTIDGIDADCSNWDPGCAPYYWFGTYANHITVQHGKAHAARGGNTGGTEASGVDMSPGGGYNTVYDMDIFDNGNNNNADHAIYMNGPSNLIDSNRITTQNPLGGGIYGPGGTAISFNSRNGSNSSVVKNNFIYSNGVVAIEFAGEFDGIQVFNNVIYSNGTSNGNPNANGIAFYNNVTATNFGIYFNTIYNNRGYCIAHVADPDPGIFTGTVFRNNICYANVLGGIGPGLGSITQSNNTFANPLFVNAGAGNFNLTNPGSPAIAAGLAGTSITTDITGATRPTPPSTGAYDVSSPPPTIETFYVNKLGNDGNSCMTAQSPTDANAKLTIAGGISGMGTSDTLLVGNGVYAEALRNSIPSGVSGSPTYIKAENPGQVTLRPSSGASVISFTGTTTSQYILIDGLIVDGVTSTGNPVLVSKDPTGSAHHLTFQNGVSLNGVAADGFKIGKPGNGAAHHDNQVLSWESYNNAIAGLYINGAATTTVNGLYSHNNGGSGLGIYSGVAVENDSNIVRNSRFIANGGVVNNNDSSVYIAAGTGNLFYNNVLSGGTRFGASPWYGINILINAANTGLYFNTIYAAPDNCVIIQSAAGNTGTLLRNDICYQNGTDTITDGGTGTIMSNNSLGASPPFVNAPGGNFHLGFSSPSPVIGQGVQVAGITADADGIARTNPPDIGAFQYVAPTPGFITTATPNSGVRTATGLNVALAGQFTSWSQGASVCSFSGTGITGNSTTVTSVTAATCNITIASNATLGARTVNMTTAGGVANLVNGFTVLTAPAITSATPNSGVRSQTINVALVGSNTSWVQGSSTGSFSGTGVTVNSTTVSSATAATLNVSLSPTATLGLRDVLMTTGGSTATLTNGFTVNQVPTKLGYTTQPPASVNSGATLSNVVVAVQFADSTTSTTSTNSVTIALCAGSPPGTLSGTLTRNAVAGLATFNNLVVTYIPGSTGYTLCATATGLTGATSNSFNVVGFGPPTKVVFTTQPPAAINSGAAIPNVVAAVQFANSTTDASSMAAVTIAICGGSPAGTLSGTLVRNAVAGVATFSGLSITSGVGGAGYTLCITSPGLTSAVSNSFTVNVPAQQPTKLGFTTQPPASVNSGTALSNVVVAVQFADGSTSTTSTNSVTISICGGSPAGTLTGTLTRTAVAGLATFNNLVITTVNGGAGYTLCAIASGLTSATSDGFTVVGLGPATKVAFTTQPPVTVNSGVVLSTVRVSVQFSNSTTDTNSTASVTIDICGGSPVGTLSGTLTRNAVAGVAAFNDLSITSVLGGAGYTLCAASAPLTSAVSDSFTVNVPVPVPTQLGFTTQPPTSTVTGATLSSVVVAVQFPSGVTDNTATNAITLNLCSGIGNLSGTLTRAAINGLSTFDNLVVTSAAGGANFALCATAAGLVSATSDNFNVVVPPPVPTSLRVAVQPPSSVLSGTVLSAINIAVTFSNGTTDVSATNSITIAMCPGSPTGVLGGTLLRSASMGVASFNDLTITTATGGPGYTLCATAVSLTSTTTNSFTVNIPASTCTTNPLQIKNVSWPTSQTGSRSLGWNSAGFSIAGVNFTYPGTALFTDTRGCQTTVHK